MNIGWRYIDTGYESGFYNMKFDETLAHDLQSGMGAPTLRLFRWMPWAISLGFNQDGSEIDTSVCTARGIDIVRRPTGGRAILHAEELTYSVVMYSDNSGVLEIYNRISQALVRGLRAFGVEVTLQKSQPNFAEHYKHPPSIPCFSSSARYEIEHKGKKLVGSAQRRFRDGRTEVVLQHGSLLVGPEHRQLTECLAIQDRSTLERIRRELIERTTDLTEISGRAVGYDVLAACIKQGFEKEWGITFANCETSFNSRIQSPYA